MRLSVRHATVLVVAFASSVPGVASAESFAALSKQGYSVGKLGPGKSGAMGWVLSNGGKRFFCKMRASMAYSGKNGMVSFTTSGRMVKLDRGVFEASIGGPDPTIPQLADLQAGRLRPNDVGSCGAI
jgi:hypothetical protein